MCLLNEYLRYASHLPRRDELITPRGSDTEWEVLDLCPCTPLGSVAAALCGRWEWNTLSLSPAIKWRNLYHTFSADYRSMRERYIHL